MVVSTGATMASGSLSISSSTISFSTTGAAEADGLVGDRGVGREIGVKEEALELKTNSFAFGFMAGGCSHIFTPKIMDQSSIDLSMAAGCILAIVA